MSGVMHLHARWLMSAAQFGRLLPAARFHPVQQRSTAVEAVPDIPIAFPLVRADQIVRRFADRASTSKQLASGLISFDKTRLLATPLQERIAALRADNIPTHPATVPVLLGVPLLHLPALPSKAQLRTMMHRFSDTATVEKFLQAADTAPLGSRVAIANHYAAWAALCALDQPEAAGRFSGAAMTCTHLAQSHELSFVESRRHLEIVMCRAFQQLYAPVLEPREGVFVDNPVYDAWDDYICLLSSTAPNQCNMRDLQAARTSLAQHLAQTDVASGVGENIWETTRWKYLHEMRAPQLRDEARRRGDALAETAAHLALKYFREHRWAETHTESANRRYLKSLGHTWERIARALLGRVPDALEAWLYEARLHELKETLFLHYDGKIPKARQIEVRKLQQLAVTVSDAGQAVLYGDLERSTLAFKAAVALVPVVRWLWEASGRKIDRRNTFFDWRTMHHHAEARVAAHTYYRDGRSDVTEIYREWADFCQRVHGWVAHSHEGIDRRPEGEMIVEMFDLGERAARESSEAMAQGNVPLAEMNREAMRAAVAAVEWMVMQSDVRRSALHNNEYWHAIEGRARLYARAAMMTKMAKAEAAYAFAKAAEIRDQSVLWLEDLDYESGHDISAHPRWRLMRMACRDWALAGEHYMRDDVQAARAFAAAGESAENATLWAERKLEVLYPSELQQTALWGLWQSRIILSRDRAFAQKDGNPEALLLYEDSLKRLQWMMMHTLAVDQQRPASMPIEKRELMHSHSLQFHEMAIRARNFTAEILRGRRRGSVHDAEHVIQNIEETIIWLARLEAKGQLPPHHQRAVALRHREIVRQLDVVFPREGRRKPRAGGPQRAPRA
jgi:hypothetical protein